MAVVVSRLRQPGTSRVRLLSSARSAAATTACAVSCWPIAAAERGDVDDRPAAACDHCGQQRVGEVDHGGDVDHDLLVGAPGRDRLEAALGGEAGVVDQDVDLHRELGQAAAHRVCGVLAREVFGDHLDPYPVGLSQARGRLAQALL